MGEWGRADSITAARFFALRSGEVTGSAGGVNGPRAKQQSCFPPHGISVGNDTGITMATSFECTRGQQACASAPEFGLCTGAAWDAACRSDMGAPQARRVATMSPAMYFFAITRQLLQDSVSRLCDGHHTSS